MNTYGEVYEIRISGWSGDLDAFRGYDLGDAAGTDESEHLDTFDDREDAIRHMNHKPGYMNEIFIEPLGVHVSETEMFTFPLDDRGIVDDSGISEPWIADYSSQRTVVIASERNPEKQSVPKMFNTFEEAKDYAIRFSNLLSGSIWKWGDQK